MEGTRRWEKASFLTILWAFLAVLVLGTQAVLATEVCVDFEDPDLANGDCVEGLGTVHDLLDISDAIIGENLILIQEGVEPKAYTGGEEGINECLDPVNESGHGFGNEPEVTETEDLTFTFAPSINVTSFSIRMVDYGDNFAYLIYQQNTTHEVRLVAYNIEGDEVAADSLTFTSTGYGTILPTSQGDIPLSTAGDACCADTGQPGQWMFSVSGQGITCVELQFIPDDIGWLVSTDADVAFDDICFTYDGGVVNVDIDIKPGSYPNPINQGSNGLIPVAILTTETFNAADVDPGTVTLNGANVAVRGKSEKMMARLEDVDGDGDEDLMLQVDTESWDELGADGEVILMGYTYVELGAEEIQGIDYVIIVPPE